MSPKHIAGSLLELACIASFVLAFLIWSFGQ